MEGVCTDEIARCMLGGVVGYGYDHHFRFSLAAEYFRFLSKRPPTRNRGL